MIKEDSLSTMRQFQVDYETTVPPWHTGHEQIEAENLDTVREKFCSKHEAARIYKVTEVLYDQSRSIFSESKYG